MVYTSIDNKKIKELKKLHNKKYRDQYNMFLVEGEHLVEEAYKSGYLKELIVKEDLNYSIDFEINYANEKVMKYLTQYDTPSKMIGVCEKKENKILGNRILVLDEIRDPGNLGTIIRSAVAFNVDTIILGTNTVDLYNSKVISSSEGMLFHINIIKKEIREIIPYLKNENYRILGTKVTTGKNIKTLAKNEKECIIMGNEGKGVSEDILNLCDEYVYINMSKHTESLNVAVATSIILYELDK